MDLSLPFDLVCLVPNRSENLWTSATVIYFHNRWLPGFKIWVLSKSLDMDRLFRGSQGYVPFFFPLEVTLEYVPFYSNDLIVY